MLRYKHNSARLKREFLTLIDPMLRWVLLELNYYSQVNFKKQLVITSLVRTVEENDKVGGRPRSAHLEARAGDCRSWIYTERQIERLKSYTKMTWGPKVHFVWHNSGHGAHIHLNINRQYATKRPAEPMDGRPDGIHTAV